MTAKRSGKDWRDYVKADVGVRHRGADAIVSARMTSVGLQAKTAGALKLTPTMVEAKAIIVDSAGKAKVERSAVTALFDNSACAVMRLWRNDDISDDGAFWAVKFAWAGDRVMGAVRVKTSQFDDTPRAPAMDGLEPSERDATAREIWDRSQTALGRRLFRMLDLVMRHDASSVEAARAAYPNVRDRKKLSGMGDAALITCCERLEETFVRSPKSSNYAGMTQQ